MSYYFFHPLQLGRYLWAQATVRYWTNRRKGYGQLHSTVWRGFRTYYRPKLKP